MAMIHNKYALTLIILLLSLLCLLNLDQDGIAYCEGDGRVSDSSSDEMQLMDQLRTEISSFKKHPL